MKKAVTWGLAISYIILFIAMGVMGIKIFPPVRLDFIVIPQN